MKKSYLAVAFVSFIIMVAGAAWAALLYTEPVSERVQELDYSFSYGSSYDVSAEVVNENPIYDVGSKLTDMAGYFYSISPVAEMTFTLDFDPSIEDANVSVETETVLLIQNLDDNDVPYWTKEITVSSSSFSFQGTSSNTDVQYIDAEEIYSTIEDISNEVGGSSGRAVGYYVTTVLMTGSISNTDINEQASYSIPMYFRSDYYYADSENANTQTQTRSFYTIREIETNREVMDLWMQIVIAAFGLLVFLYAVAAGRTKDGSDYAEFKDWVSEGSFPGGGWEKEVYIPILKDLVDIAIDTGKRVIYDKEEDIFFVIDGNVLYFLTKDEEES
ncbi:MAG TPA: DUF5305 family protein [Candidatus Methanofastidiosa archaeon]|nr:DUF5305 family protein [Candidatus Methanofastidiosa archaeon]HPR42399.1 DUF5305 family protein [Candidatus Methanofastidiosa archaeon]